ncbi:MAG: 50S ribosomal protein L18 [Clostridia bacterium]|nr:MAG: 50S ribosomal protein L18 [Clostridia bacterium]
MLKKVSRNEQRKIRHRRVRRKVYGTPARPRLSVFRSSAQIYCQIIDDTRGHTLVAASSLDPELRDGAGGVDPKEVAHRVGELVAHRAVEKGIKEVIFDRGGYVYHGRVAALADGARSGGLVF